MTWRQHRQCINEVKPNYVGSMKLESKDTPRQPSRPTSCKPGSKEKIEILAERVRLGQDLAHPEDTTIARTDEGEDSPPPMGISGKPRRNSKHGRP